MISIEQSPYASAILHKLKLPFGNFYLCDQVIVSEVFEETLYGLKEARMVFEKAGEFYKSVYNVKKRVYLSNRINSYSVKPVSWLSFEHTSKFLLGYGVIDSRPNGITNALLESKFVPIEFGNFDCLEDAMLWVNRLNNNK